MNNQNRKMKLKRSNEIRKLDEFTQEEIEEINSVKHEPEGSEVFDKFSLMSLKIDSGKEETSI
jgi:hypothetical protein